MSISHTCMTHVHALPRRARFPLGGLYVTAAVHRTIAPADIIQALSRHARGDWGEVSGDDRKANEHGLRYGVRLLSVYRDRDGITFWIITERDRSATTVLLPDDY